MFPVAFELFGYPINFYGIFLALAFLAALYVAVALGRASGISPEAVGDVTLVALIAGLAGGRLLYVIVEWDQFAGNLSSIIFRRDGFVFYGGLLFAIPAVILFIRRRKLPLLATADVLTPALALAHSIGRLGCFAQGCCYGRPFKYGVTFPLEAPATYHFGEVPVHPTQLYESFFLILIFMLLLYVKRRKLFEGAVLVTYLGFYGVARFIVETFRADDRGFYLGAFSVSQLISIGIVATAIIAWLRFRKLS